MSHLPEQQINISYNYFTYNYWTEELKKWIGEYVERYRRETAPRALPVPGAESSSQGPQTSDTAGAPVRIGMMSDEEETPEPNQCPMLERLLRMFDIEVLKYFNDKIILNHNRVLEIAEVYDQMRPLLVSFSNYTAFKNDAPFDRAEMPDKLRQLIKDQNRARRECRKEPHKDNEERLRTLNESVRVQTGRWRAARQLDALLHALELHALASFAATFDLNALSGELRDSKRSIKRATQLISRMLLEFAMSRKDFITYFRPRYVPHLSLTLSEHVSIPRSVAPRPLDSLALKQLEMNYLFEHMQLYEPSANLWDDGNSAIPEAF